MNNHKIQTKLAGVPETMLIPLRAKYLETVRTNGIINDPKSVEIIHQIAYDFTGKKEVSALTQTGVAIRTEILDELTSTFLSQHKNAVVVNLGCGLDTRLSRLKNDTATWYDLDLPEAIIFRRKFFTETNKNIFIAKSVLDFSWVEQIPKDKPTLFIAEGLLMYFTEKEVKSILKKISTEFPGAEMVLEAMSPFIAKRSAKHPEVKNYNATFKWGLKTGKELNKWDMNGQFIHEYYFNDRHKSRLPIMYRIITLIPTFRKMMKIIHLSFHP